MMKTKETITLRPHQEEVLENWELNNYFGFVQHGTASGKTITGLEAIKRWHEANENNYALVVVPTKVLMFQWIEEIDNFFEDDVFTIKKGGGLDTSNWRGAILTFKEGNFVKRYNIILTTYNSLAGDFPKEKIESENLLLVADEAHNLGTPQRKKILTMETGAALGLSATPDRFEESETEEIIQFFKGVLEPIYGIKEGIRDGYLSKYDYFVKTVYLTSEELIDWKERTKIIVSLSQRLETEKDRRAKKEIKLSLDRQRQERAKIKKNAENKSYFVKPILEEHYQRGDRWLIYCNDKNQVKEVYNSIKGLEMEIMQYFSSSSEDISGNLEYFEKLGGVILCCKMLDEGVNIPAINKGIILASSQTAREFIQRRGRLLRTALKKRKAQIWDPIVVPPERTERFSSADSLVIAEIERAAVFGSTADNRTAMHKIESIALQYNIDFESILQKVEEEE